ncbi:MAG TPA: TetR family transcriptional regulator [Nocardioidaceae bacterium]|nr:TetR family transcriptional regulator [Nocardioidaceae bacterium]
MPSTLRERKKLATRRHIAEVAKELFTARGFDDVTVAEVASAADVSKMTVFNYFPRKEDLFLDRHADQVRDIEQLLADRAPGESVATVLRRYEHRLLETRHELSGAVEGIAGCWEVISASPTLLSRLHEQALELQTAIGDALAAETGDPMTSRLVAGQLAAARGTIFETALRRMVEGEDVEQVRRDQAALIDTAFDFVEHGIGDFGAVVTASTRAG